MCYDGRECLCVEVGNVFTRPDGVRPFLACFKSSLLPRSVCLLIIRSLSGFCCRVCSMIHCSRTARGICCSTTPSFLLKDDGAIQSGFSPRPSVGRRGEKPEERLHICANQRHFF